MLPEMGARRRAASVVEIPGKVKPWRVIFWENDKRTTRHFPTKLEAIAFASDKNLECNLGNFSVTEKERLFLAILRRVAEDNGIDMDRIHKACVETAERVRKQTEKTLGEASRNL